MSRFNNWSLNINKINLSHAERHLDEFDIIINTTPAGMNGNKDSVISLNRLASHTLVSDIVYNPYKTPILIEAEQKEIQSIMVSICSFIKVLKVLKFGLI